MSEGEGAPASAGAFLLADNRSVRDLGDRLRNEEERPTDRDALAEWRAFNCTDFAELHGRIDAALQGMPFLLACRVKRLDSVVRKLRRMPNMTLERMDDLVGFRVLVDTYEAQAEAVRRLTEALEPDRPPKDYVTQPQSTGYRAVHLIPRRELQLPRAQSPGRYSYEIQVRTFYQHLWSSTSESFGEQVKEGGGQPEIREYLLTLSDQLKELEVTQPALVQASYVQQAGALEFFAIQFDHKDSLLRCDSLGHDIRTALRTFSYLEAAGRTSHAREVALLGVASDEAALRQTHIRYFAPGGRPALPESVIARPPDTWT